MERKGRAAAKRRRSSGNVGITAAPRDNSPPPQPSSRSDLKREIIKAIDDDTAKTQQQQQGKTIKDSAAGADNNNEDEQGNSAQAAENINTLYNNNNNGVPLNSVPVTPSNNVPPIVVSLAGLPPACLPLALSALATPAGARGSMLPQGAAAPTTSSGNPESEAMFRCLTSLLKSLLPPQRQRLLCTRDVYVGIPCNADRKCIDKFLGQKRGNSPCCAPCCKPAPPPPPRPITCCGRPCQPICPPPPPPPCCHDPCKPCGKCQPCCAVPPTAPCCCIARCPKRARKRSIKYRRKVSKDSDGSAGKSHETIDSGTDAPKQDAAVEVEAPKVPKRNVVTGMLSRTMVGDIRYAYVRGSPSAQQRPLQQKPSLSSINNAVKVVTRDITNYISHSGNDFEDQPTRSSSSAARRAENNGNELVPTSPTRMSLRSSRALKREDNKSRTNNSSNRRGSATNNNSSPRHSSSSSSRGKQPGKFWTIG